MPAGVRTILHYRRSLRHKGDHMSFRGSRGVYHRFDTVIVLNTFYFLRDEFTSTRRRSKNQVPKRMGLIRGDEHHHKLKTLYFSHVTNSSAPSSDWLRVCESLLGKVSDNGSKAREQNSKFIGQARILLLASAVRGVQVDCSTRLQSHSDVL